MKIMPKVLFACLFSYGLAVLFYSCDKPKEENYPKEPKIILNYIPTNTLSLSDPKAKYQITIEFTDGDGDLADEKEAGRPSLYIQDSRDTAFPIVHTFPLPYIAPELRQKNGAVKGSVTLDLHAGYFFIRQDSIPRTRDTMRWDVYLIDKALNVSNVVVTPDIYITQ